MVHALYDFTICMFTTVYIYERLKAATDGRKYLIN
jgi:hypothetical protein